MEAVTLEPVSYKPYSNVVELLHLVRTDQTRKLPAQYRSGISCLLVLRNFNANDVLVEPVPSRKTGVL